MSVPSAASNPLRILVAEDNEVNLRLALLMLEKLGHRADVAGNGAEAIRALDRCPYDIILMDCQMPELDGLAATRAIRALEAAHPEVEPVQIIAMTANAMKGDRENCLAAGMDDYVSKPVRLDTLNKALEAAATRIRTRAEVRRAAPVEAPSATQAIRTAVGDLERDFGPEAALELVQSFLTDTPPRLGELEHSDPGSDPVALARLAHSIAGSCSIFGGEELRRLGLQVEDILQSGRFAEAAAGIQAMKAEYAGMLPELEQEAARLGRATTG